MANIKKSSSYWINNSDISKYLLPYLSPTTPGTKYWESQPSGKLTDRQVGRILADINKLTKKYVGRFDGIDPYAMTFNFDMTKFMGRGDKATIPDKDYD